MSALEIRTVEQEWIERNGNNEYRIKLIPTRACGDFTIIVTMRERNKTLQKAIFVYDESGGNKRAEQIAEIMNKGVKNTVKRFFRKPKKYYVFKIFPFLLLIVYWLMSYRKNNV